jgi:COP9 signalosome complex subunit 6
VKQVHQDRHLEFVGWYTLVPSSGPSATILPIQPVFQQYNETAILLAFHPDVVHSQATGSKLPLTIYESILEVKGLSAAKPDLQDTEDKPMEDGDGRPQTKFRQVPYSVEVDETEMISLNYVASTSGNAASLSTAKDEKVSRSVESNGKGKRRLVESAEADQVQKDSQDLTTEEEETIAFITMKSNAIKMLQSRIELVKTYLENLPPSFVAPGAKLDDLMDTDSTTPSNKILRQIQALVSRLDLIVPADKESFEREVFDETNDASLIILLNQVVQSANDARNAGKKTHVVETARAMSQRRTTSGLDLPGGQADLSSLGAGDIMM